MQRFRSDVYENNHPLQYMQMQVNSQRHETKRNYSHLGNQYSNETFFTNDSVKTEQNTNMLEDCICTVASCKKSSLKAKRQGERLAFFLFPKDPIAHQRWIKICKCKNKIRSANRYICSKHFKPDDFEDNHRAPLLSPTHKKLKNNVVPSLFLHRGEAISSNKKDDQIPPLCSPETLRNLKRHFQQEKDILKMKIADLENEEYINKLKIYEIDKKIGREHAEFESYVKFALNQLPAVDQIQISVNKIVKLRWTTKGFEKPFTVTLKYISKPLYTYLREILHYPLPKLPVLDKWIESVKKRKIRKGKFSKFKRTFWYLKQLKK